MKVFTLKIMIVLSLLSFMSFHTAPESAAWSYIDEYKDLAIAEMYRTGIPASITLSQGLHESTNGTSRLAVEANNHFGIKCKSYWVGAKFYHKDDDLDTSGNLLESCFRAYGNSLESYVDHSNFLVNSRHYKELFTFDKTDYISWAYGLKRCGYATDEQYPEKLINKINQYSLYQYDTWESPFRTEIKY